MNSHSARKASILLILSLLGLGSAAHAQWTDQGTYIQADNSNPPVVVTDSGALGIGVTSPTAKLHVGGDSYFALGEGLRLLGNSNFWGTDRDARIFRMIDDGGSNAVVDGGLVFEAQTALDGQSAPLFVLRRTGSTVWSGIGVRAPIEPFRVQGARELGDGTISSSGTDVYGTGTLFKSQLRVGAEILVGTSTRMVQNIVNDTELKVDPAFDTAISQASYFYTVPLFAVLQNGNIGIGSSKPVSRFVVTNRAYVGNSAWTATIDSATNDSSSAVLNLRNYDAQSIFYARGDGKIGVGTTAPASTFDIAGDLAINGSPVINSYGNWVGGGISTFALNSHGLIYLFESNPTALVGTISATSDRIDASATWRFGDKIEINGNSYGGYLDFGTGYSRVSFSSGFDPSKDLYLNLGQSGNGTLEVDGNVLITGNLQVLQSVSKSGGSFKIDHPLSPDEMYLYHSFVESPERLNVYSGNIETDSAGEAWVELPEYFQALNENFRYQLTCIGTFAQAIVAEEIQQNRFLVRTDKPFVKLSWQVTGARKDAWAKEHPLVPEVKKAQ